jgi:hypothetical protein
MNSFEEWWQGDAKHKVLCRANSQQAWQHQQAKIDRLKKQVEELQLELIQALSDSENYGFGEK